MNRRSFLLTAGSAFLAAPAIVKASSLMALSLWPDEYYLKALSSITIPWKHDGLLETMRVMSTTHDDQWIHIDKYDILRSRPA